MTIMKKRRLLPMLLTLSVLLALMPAKALAETEYTTTAWMI